MSFPWVFVLWMLSLDNLVTFVWVILGVLFPVLTLFSSFRFKHCIAFETSVSVSAVHLIQGDGWEGATDSVSSSALVAAQHLQSPGMNHQSPPICLPWSLSLPSPRPLWSQVLPLDHSSNLADTPYCPGLVTQLNSDCIASLAPKFGISFCLVE